MKPILFNTEMARAIGKGKKTQTRRAIKDKEMIDIFLKNGEKKNKVQVIDRISKYKTGDILWVREPAKIIRFDNILKQCDYQYKADDKNIYQADIPKRILSSHINCILYPDKYPSWLTSCKGVPNGCLKEMARTFLEITAVRVKRLQDISYEDILAEGFPHKDLMGNAKQTIALGWLQELWDSCAKDGYKWENNPYVFVYDFKRVENELISKDLKLKQRVSNETYGT